MASENLLQQLSATLDKLEKVDTEKLLRRNLGEESLEKVFTPQMDEIRRLREFVGRHARHVHDEHVGQARGQLEAIANQMTAQANRPSAEYIAQRDNFLREIASHLEESKRFTPAFVGAAVLERGFLEDEGIKQEYQRTVDNLRSETASTLAHVREEAEKAVQGAKALAEEIETRARRTATRISVKDAQDQFSGASEDFATKVKLWAQLTVVASILLVASPFAFMWWPLPPNSDWPVSLYHTLLRVFVLTAVGAIATLCIRMLRAHMHLAEKNRHRVRVANSVESFVNSALEPQQRDLILAKLAEAIVDFGDSGLIRGDRDDGSSSIVSADLLGRILAAVTQKRPS